MYGRRKKRKNSESMETVLGRGTVFEGNISCEGSVKVDGNLKGDVKISGTLVVGPDGSMTGDIKAEEIIVFGSINGNIEARELEIKSTGTVSGEALIETLVSEAGGVMKANCQMKNPASDTEKPQTSDASGKTKSAKT